MLIFFCYLLYHEDGELEILCLQERDHVPQEDG